LLALLQVNLRDFAVWLTACAVTLFGGVEYGLLSSIALSMAILILDTAFPQTSLLGRIPRTNMYRPVPAVDPCAGSATSAAVHTAASGVVMMPGIVAVRLDAALLFINVVSFEEQLQQHVRDAERVARDTGGEQPA
jgi:MFS superfamily sulfate permease-like transporter